MDAILNLAEEALQKPIQMLKDAQQSGNPSAKACRLNSMAPERAVLWMLEYGINSTVSMPGRLTDIIAQDPSKWMGDPQLYKTYSSAYLHCKNLLSKYYENLLLDVLGDIAKPKGKAKGKAKAKAKAKAAAEAAGSNGSSSDEEDEESEQEEKETDEI
eukprot:12423819-Karenia_brevis.AAC.1